jgi:LacI family transcriptional regulator
MASATPPPARRGRAKTRPTIRDVAAEARVSVKTVSRVLNDEPNVLPATAEHVRAVVARLGFRRNEAAANLRRLDDSTRTIGLVIEDLGNPFYSALARGVEEVARAAGYLLMVASSDEDPATEKSVLTTFCARRADALIVVPTRLDHGFLASEIEAGTAVVFVDRPALIDQVDSVLTANAEGAAKAVNHLLAHGHRRVAYVGDEAGIFTAEERLRGYMEALAKAGIQPDDTLVRIGRHDTEAAEAVANDLLSATDPPTAFFTGNNRLTVGVLHAIRRHHSPAALVGFDDLELADLLSPGITVVAQNAGALGRTAAELVLRRIAGDDRPAHTVTLGTRLIPRGSGEIRGPHR